MAEFSASVLLDTGEMFQQHTNKKHPLGTRGFTRDGRVFRYALNGATALSPGQVIQAEAAESTVLAQEYADSTDWALPTTDSHTFYLSTDTTIATKDFFADGYFMVTAGSTDVTGQSLQIKTNTGKAGAAGPGGCPVIETYSEDKLVTALTTTHTVSLIPNPYSRVIAGKSADAAITGIPVGVCPGVVAAGKYFWLQTWGMACVWASGTWDAGRDSFYDSQTGCSNEGAAKTFATCSVTASGGVIPIGSVQYIGVDGSCGALFIKLAP